MIMVRWCCGMSCHSAGVIPRRLDDWQRRPGCRLHLQVPQRRTRLTRIRLCARRSSASVFGSRSRAGWDRPSPFEMAEHYTPSDGIRRFLSGTPSIIGMLAMQDMLALIEQAGLEAIRAKSVALTEFAIADLRPAARPARASRSARLGTRRGAGVTSRWSILSFAWRHTRLWERGSFLTSVRPTGCGSGSRR